MKRSPQHIRIACVLAALAAVFGALAFRLFQLHVLRHGTLSAEATAIRERVVHREGRRGTIVDRNGNLLANSLSVHRIVADPQLTASQAPVIAQKLAPLLRKDEAALVQLLTRQSRYVRLDQKIDEETLQKIRSLKLPGISAEDQFQRSYPNAALASHVVGFVDADHKGVQGIEASMQNYLQGQAGYEVIERDRKGREIRSLRTEEIGPRDGYTVALTIDQVIQHIAETELDRAMAEHRPRAATIIVTRPRTGEILAMSCRPTFDSNNPGPAPADARRNRAISDVAEPGSTFKVITVSGALNEGIVNLADRLDCENGAFIYAGRALHDAHPFGVLSVEEILYHSSNIGAAKIALKLGPPRLADYISRYGFGRKTGIELPGEVSGIAHPLSRWSKLSITRIPMGHEIAVTPLQMIMAVNAVASGGQLMKPIIVKSVTDEAGNAIVQARPQLVTQCLAPRTSVLMTMALRKVVSPEGTAPKAALDGYDVAGKTGTAQKIENGQYVNRYYSSFIGYFPASDPQISILISLDDPAGGAYYGGTVAGPIFKAVAEKIAQYLGMAPTMRIIDPTKVASLS